MREICSLGSVRGAVVSNYGRPIRARSRKRRIQTRLGLMPAHSLPYSDNRDRASGVKGRLRLSIAIPIPMPIPNARVFQRQIEFDPHDQTLSRSILMHSCIRRIPAASPAKRVAITCESLTAAGNALSASESGSESQSLSGFGCYKPIATLDCDTDSDADSECSCFPAANRV